MDHLILETNYAWLAANMGSNAPCHINTSCPVQARTTAVLLPHLPDFGSALGRSHRNAERLPDRTVVI